MKKIDISTKKYPNTFALIDDEDYIQGFAFYRTGFNASPSYATWIWAESVYRKHKLKNWR